MGKGPVRAGREGRSGSEVVEREQEKVKVSLNTQKNSL